ncbi:MAG: ketoacid CoA transferase [SAR86 cluster bacterium]|jgi:glutaconate CoA-transferase subunit B|nr:ketoacid CoA transferase [SAR86 cluster bacterium]MDA8799148.1 ketoacid CoA transferase [Gammaproteobacteria bacterium]MDA9947246.1 ketoacid CoA transferase [bacterium]MBL6701373.1 ketoacid CoA transferase [SAR86 cluster bacterium]MBL6822201.1 ketoacid CoA transferase [SAR86 cluster bacterium]|tara:strand:+ start:949 stop:1704 length:756 start_codon:yes stop_codon:yes gene_type:complete
MSDSPSLAEICISASSKAWHGDGEILATGIGLIPRIAAGLAKLTHNPDLMMTDGETYLISRPVPMGKRDVSNDQVEGYMSYSRVFENLWGGKRHAMVTPTQIDSFGQTNISAIGDYNSPKVQLLGVRGFPGNFINHKNSIFIPNHSVKTFVEGEVDMVSGMGFKNKDLSNGKFEIKLVVTNLGVFDFSGENNNLQLLSLHPGVNVDDVVTNTGFDVLIKSDEITSMPSNEELTLIREVLDPQGFRNSIFGE